MSELQIYTDGSCLKNPGGPGGWAYVAVLDGRIIHENSGGTSESTNNIMELCAVLKALSWLGEYQSTSGLIGGKVHIWTDSQYVKYGVQDWSHNWFRNNWKTANGKPVKNQELWREVLSRTILFNLEWHWVRGHAGNAMNERADQLARAAAEAS